MTSGESDPHYKTLTSMLHWKEDLASFMVAHLEAIFNEACKTKKSSDNGTKLVHVLITEEADLCLTASLGLNLENKIVLAVATRLAAERFMIGKIKDDKFVAGI